jgi:hypothetical protein
VTRRGAAGFFIGLAVFFLVLLKSEPGFVPILDFANLLFHEAGHPAYGLFSAKLAVYGGTLGQLTFPVILMISFWRKGLPISFAICWVWLFENFLNIARYMADSRALELPLVGGGDHDWNEIFFRWKVLHYDVEIGNVTRWIGWAGMTVAAVWILWRTWRDSRRLNLAED